MHRYLGTMYPDSKTFEWFYNKNAAHKWIPNIFGKTPFQSSKNTVMSIWRIYFLTSTWGNRFLEESSYCIMIAKTKSTSMLELGFWQWPHTTLTLNNPFFQPLSFLFHLMCKMVVWLAVGTTNTLVKLKNRKRPSLVYPSHKVSLA